MQLPVFKLEEYLSEREFSCEVVFSASDMDSFHMRELLDMADEECKDLWDNLFLNYTQPMGHPLLLSHLEKAYFSGNKGRVCCFAGAEEAIFAACNVILKKSDHAVVVSPCYQSLQEIPEAICEVSCVSLRKNDQRYYLDLDDLKNSVKDSTKLIIINFPHNPTGIMISRDEQAELVSFARERGIYIFSDEVYRGLEHDPKDQLPPLASIYEKALSLGVMSKSYGLPGLRIGWLATQDHKLLKEIEAYKYYLSICNSAPAEILSLIALRNEDRLLQRNHALLRKNLHELKQFFASHSKILQWYEPQGGCTAFPKLLSSEGVADFADRLLKKTGVLILPGNVYGVEDNHFRVGYGRFSMQEALQRFGNFITG